MLCRQLDGHVIRKDLRHCYYWALPIALGGLWMFSILMWIIAFKPGNSLVACAIVAVIFTACSCLLSIIPCKQAWVLGAKYFCKHGVIANYSARGNHFLNLEEGFFCSKITIPFTVGTARIREQFFLFSSCSISGDSRVTLGGISSIKYILSSKVIILPDNEDVGNWIAHETGIKNISAYPRAMFFQRKPEDNPLP